MNDSAVRPPRGYLSEAGKRSFTITAGILGAVFFMAQFAVPFFVMIVAMPGMMMDMAENLKAAQPERGAYWRNRIWYVEERAPFGTDPKAGYRLQALSVSGQVPAETIAGLGGENPWLLADDDRLWAISASYLASVRGHRLDVHRQRKTLGDISRPFLYRGRPAIFESTPGGERLLVLRDMSWTEEKKVDFGLDTGKWSIGKDLQAFWDGTRLHILLHYGKSLYHLPGLPGRPGTEAWTPVADACGRWTLAGSATGPMAFVQGRAGEGLSGVLLGYRLQDGTWRESLRTKVLPGATGVFEDPGTGTLHLLHQSFPGSLRYMAFRDGELTRQFRTGKASPFPTHYVGLMMIPQTLTLLMPLMLAFILSALMKTYRSPRHTADGGVLPFASLARRALAQVLDGLIFGGPIAVGSVLMFRSVFDFEKMLEDGPFGVFAGFGLVGFGLLWMLAIIVVFSLTEGRWGATPGKWALGIRVLGTDHRPCGFGRAIVRNLLTFVDGFFNFLVGVMVVALSENWQRVGDMAARTVVVELRSAPDVPKPEALFRQQAKA